MAIVWSVELAPLARLCRRCPPLLDNFWRALKEQRRAEARQEAEGGEERDGGEPWEEGDGEESVGRQAGEEEERPPTGPQAV
jgi:hypothetical protein